ncbi:Hpt domain-containing protein [Nodularia sphaerocarpa]|uniref:Hpt domain-containing protein n=1 Tax=Nodularia sphaerocarpa TaxID=137816 RepID=UPI001EFBC0EE|nr:Hpt domain-containing protein [Nodularia sphaerocarpa]MDB9373822.1 Hpt domain-containing protein [Nodularia sphaerocarpa CS-585]MDB9380426.1 Hpt domain-containing protein [Nodularia sphaerocarpa CS-585A2]ULP72869.1 hypothetical protein BDGGKGIB_02520 [Nodularia sphaerocarpa UHCC 0038]
MQGDREACLAANIDDKISQPVQIEELALTLSKCQPRKNDQLMSSNLSRILTPNTEPTIIDPEILNSLRDMMSGDEAAFVQLLNCYLAEAPKYIQNIRASLVPEDAQALWKAAHCLKSSSASVGATTLAQICTQIEAKGRSNDLENIAQICSQLYKEYELVKTALQITVEK